MQDDSAKTGKRQQSRQSPSLLTLVLLCLFSLGLFTLTVGYAHWWGQNRQGDVQQMGWSMLIFVVLYLALYGVMFVFKAIGSHLINRRRKPQFSATERVDHRRRAVLSYGLKGGLMLVSAGVTRRAVINAAALPTAREIDLPIPGLPPIWDGFRIVHLTDIHANIYTAVDWMESIVGIANSLAPDVIAVTGDLADDPVDELARIVSPLSKLTAPNGRFFVTGNHEYYAAARGVNSWIRHLGYLGFDVLLNEHRMLKRGGHSLLLGGVTDYSAGFHKREHASSPSAAAKSAPPADLKILLAHQPKSIFEAVDAGFDVQLSGHTHGGQLFPGNIMMAVAQPFVSGMHRYGDTYVYVNPGAGYWGPKARIGSTAEITALVLSSA
jgi:predicted MPP superfamily phosphohydrolase